ncbi:hypothetical protein ACINNAV21_1058 [Acinetobacter baumannii Naval-21]|nr:hypothetical protein ACIN5074_1096 [Acinetobacter baumannii OIFC074]EKP49737.1 hypothetical protein ACINNAV21_1058 [Acinetobacter baumannii Naval-21]KLT82214.1 hypothetical protein T632_2767 [Acinetobacter baumannii MRSN 4106]KLT88726.1 hypothetical protein T629_2910 [Acinetobacter baumannii MRSN 3405]KLU00140.1 hypothetical protein T631_2840 [Acinetobacter baumannii MRSN 3942]CQR68714.1 fragment of Orfc273-4 from Vibrio metschnikovii [Acinetobacter baumannii]
MNCWILSNFLIFWFLNGVCRHELIGVVNGRPMTFLNGVCRHEQIFTPINSF